jgi:hypothetical protein
MKRFFLVLTVAAFMATMLVVMAVPAWAQPVECEWDYFEDGWFAQYCWSPDRGWWIDDWWKAW